MLLRGIASSSLISVYSVDASVGTERGNDTVLERLIAQRQRPEGSFTDERIRDNLIGCTVGIMDNVAGAFANALDVLLDRPEQLEALAAADDELALRLLLEALRAPGRRQGALDGLVEAGYDLPADADAAARFTALPAS
jgi:hypothetical protein